MPQPLVSVVVPAYNAAPFIGAAIETVLAQSFTDYELIVVNYGASDTYEFERAIFPYREFLKYLNERHRGAAGARNVALRAAQGTFVAFLDADDRWYPSYLDAQVAFLRAHPAVDL